MITDLNDTNFLLSKIELLLENARIRVVSTVNHTMVITYYEIGRLIIEHEQNGKQRAEYGKQVLSEISKNLTTKFGKGFSETNLRQMRNFFLIYSIQQTASAKLENQQILSVDFKLSWSHYLKLMRIENEVERKFYELESIKNNWSLKELERQYNSGLFTRLSVSRNKEEIYKLSSEGLTLKKAKDALKDPYILEFLGLDEKNYYSENDLEEELINKYLPAST